MLQHPLSPLAQIIRGEIAQCSSISFGRFMELALYYPTLGYYRRTKDPFGAKGDFFTAGQLTPFGVMIDAFARKLFDDVAIPARVLEIGAGRQDLRSALQHWQYQPFDWNTAELPRQFDGLIVANEFFDALPVRVFRRRSGKWLERRVAVCEDAFNWIEAEVDEQFLESLARHECGAADGMLLELSPTLSEWVQRIAKMLQQGVLLVIDYGYSAEELPRFPEGTLLAYRDHRTQADVLAAPGEQDITAHVNWTDLLRFAKEAGLLLRYDGPLRSWALSLWTQDEFDQVWRASDAQWRLEWKQLVMGMGDVFRVAVFEKQNASEDRRR